ncbi:hypothetical protein GCM10009850_051260 [Nonomuraea monospora]|uniref:Uncharacterized protein n=1 Tax=Nonomuraea monospora TaxID=568818 RepID=A0ABN3CL14_9ACTN
MLRYRIGLMVVAVLAVLVAASGVIAFVTGDPRLSILFVHARFTGEPGEVATDHLVMLVLVGLAQVWALWQILPKRHDGERKPRRDDDGRNLHRAAEGMNSGEDDSGRNPGKDDDAKKPGRDDDGRNPGKHGSGRNPGKNNDGSEPARDNGERQPGKGDGGRNLGWDERLLRIVLYVWMLGVFADRLPWVELPEVLVQAAAVVLFFRVTRTVALGLRLVALAMGLLEPVGVLAQVLPGIDGTVLYGAPPVSAASWLIWIALTLVTQAKDGRWRRGTLWAGAVAAAGPVLTPQLDFLFIRSFVWFEGSALLIDVFMVVWLGRSARETGRAPKLAMGARSGSATGVPPEDATGAMPEGATGAPPEEAVGARAEDTTGAPPEEAVGARAEDTTSAPPEDATGAMPEGATGAALRA